MPAFGSRLLAACCLLTSATLAAQSTVSAAGSDSLSYRPPDPLNKPAFYSLYNMEYDQATRQFGEVLQRHPDDPYAVNHYLTAKLFGELYRLGILNTGEYAGDGFVKAQHRPVDPKFEKEIEDLVRRAFDLEDAELKANRDDIAAIYAQGATKANLAIFAGLAQRAWLTALHNALAARRDNDRVLELAPSTLEAKLIVGTQNYIAGSLPWSLRAAGSVFGLGGNKEKGLSMLKECAAGGGETAVDAKILLVLFYRREHRLDESLAIARSLIAAYPHSLLMALEEGNLLRDQGNNSEAIAVYRRVFSDGQHGRYSGLHYEIAAMSQGDLLRLLKDYSGAVAAYNEVTDGTKPEPELSQRANLAGGQMYDLLQKRDLAAKKYQAVITIDRSSKYAASATDYLKTPYHGD